MWYLMTLSALAVSPYKDKNADIVAQRTIAAAPEAVQAKIDSIEEWVSYLPATCVSGWKPAASSDEYPTITYDIYSFHRVLDFDVTVKRPGVVEVDHLGDHGFITRFALKQAPSGGTTVTMTTFLLAPGWPFREYFFTKVHPRWTECQTETLDRIARSFE